MIANHVFLKDLFFYIIAGVGVAIPALYLNIRVAKVFGLIDWPKARGITEHQVPIVGSSLVLITLLSLLYFGESYGVSPWLICTASVIGIMGFIDDRRPLPAADKIFFQLICAVVVVTMDPNIREAINDKFGLNGAILAVVFIVGLTNAVNFIDGIDGLAGLVLFFGLVGFLMFSGSVESVAAYPFIAALMMGMLAPFFYLNVFKRKGFLGNTGSYFFSFLIAAMHLSIPVDTNGAMSRMAMTGLCFIVPIADACMVVLVRLLSWRSPFQADKGHLHHRLVQSSVPLRYILLNFALVAGMSAITAGFIMQFGVSRTSYFPVFLCVGNVTITGLLILLIERASRLRIYGYFKRLDIGDPIYYLKYKISMKEGGKPPRWHMKRLEALISSEIRVTDLCVAEMPDQLFITLRTLPEPLKGISSRLEAVFAGEKSLDAAVLETGEFVKTPGTVIARDSRPRLVSNP
jgi:UDP-GlcNAc:undecaprenyl-phosphate/decaprenyl-phosphate GlcNAc-1-phosphate transferase